jgi:hypothetical protein
LKFKFDKHPIGDASGREPESHTDLETIIRDLLQGQYKNPVRVVAFNTPTGWSADVVQELRRRCGRDRSAN